MTPGDRHGDAGPVPPGALGIADLVSPCGQPDYMTLEYRAGHEAADIQALLTHAVQAGWKLHTVLADARVLILENDRHSREPLERMTAPHLDQDDDGLGEDLFPDPDRQPWHFCAEHTARGFRHPAVELADCPWCHIPTAVIARLQAAQRDARPGPED